MNILVVDDDKVFREGLSALISNLGYTTFQSENGLQALALLSHQKIHAVLTDIQMPGMDGHELLNRIKHIPQYNHILVIVLTGYGNIKDAVENMRNGAYDYILKPVNLKELTIVLRNAGEHIALREENNLLTKHFDAEVRKAVSAVKQELSELRKAYTREVGKTEIIIRSQKLEQVIEVARKLHKRVDIPVLIEGETGTGKEIIARLIHYDDGNTTQPFIGLNCAAVTSSLFESELFGYEPGAFTGGNPKGQKGKIELAEDGCLFLDEITELPLNLQAQLLRVIQEREYYRVGGVKLLTTSARFICATNQVIKQRIADGLFREDLFFRLSIGYIYIPPLRERREEILPLCHFFLNQLAEQGRTKFKRISSGAESILLNHSWPGNIRELKNTIERISLLWDEPEIRPHHLQILFQEYHPDVSAPDEGKTITNSALPPNGFDFSGFILDVVDRALHKNNGNKTATAQYLGISLRVLHTYLKHLDER